MIFERKEDESDDQWKAFLVYRDAGMSRTVTGTAQQLGVSRKTIQRYSKKHNWDRRVSAFDSWKVSEEVKQKAETISKDALSGVEKILDDLLIIAKAETAYKKKLWGEYWSKANAGNTSVKPPASSTRSIGELIRTIAEVKLQLDVVSKSDDVSNAAIDQLMEVLKNEPIDPETEG